MNIRYSHQVENDMASNECQQSFLFAEYGNKYLFTYNYQSKLIICQYSFFCCSSSALKQFLFAHYLTLSQVVQIVFYYVQHMFGWKKTEHHSCTTLKCSTLSEEGHTQSEP